MGRVLSGTAVGAERAGTRSFGPDWKWHPTAEFFLPSQFVLSSGELGVGRPCCAAQADRDLSETRPGTGGGRQREARVRESGECGPSSAEGFPLGRARSMRSAGRSRQFPLREKVCPHSACTHPQRAHSAHTHVSARCATRHVHCHMHV